MMIPESAEKVSLMESGVNINDVPSRPTENHHTFKKATILLIRRLSSFRRKSEEPRLGKNCHSQNGSMTSVNEDGGCAQCFDERFSDELSVKVCKDSIKFSLIENMRTLGSNVSCLFYIEQNEEVSAENFTEMYQHLNSSEKNLVFLWACFLKRDDLVELLYGAGADVFSTVPNEEFTALHLAAFSGGVKTCEWLISNGLQVNLVVKKLSPLHCAVLGNSLDCTRLLLRRGATIGNTVLHCAVEANATGCLQHLLRKNADVNAVDENGLTALHVAVDRGMNKCLEIIVSHSPTENLNIKTKWRKSTPLHLAAENGYFKCVKLLIDAGADVDAVNHKEQTALHLAAKAQSVECMEILLNAGCDVNAQDGDCKTPLHAAVVTSSGASNALEVLLKRKADINSSDKFGYTALHLAALDEFSECVDFLITNGADVTLRTKGGLSALSIIGRKTPGSINSICRILDSSISMSNRNTSVNKEVDLKFDFGFLRQNSSAGMVGFLKTLEEDGRTEWMEHPLCVAFLHFKWQMIRKFYFCRIFLSFVFVALFSVYLLCAVAIDRQRSSAEANTTHTNNHTSEKDIVNTTGISCAILLHNCCVVNESSTTEHDKSITWNHEKLNKVRYTVWGMLVVMASFKIFRRLIIILERRPMKLFLNTLKWFVIFSVFLVYPREGGPVPDWIKLIGSIAVLLAWTDFMVKIGGLPVFGAYIAMFTKILAEFFRLLFAYSCFLIGFTVSFCIVFSTEESFKNPLVGLVKIIAMMTGDVDTSILEKYYHPKDSITLYSALFIYTLFMLLVTIVLMNLLVGIAVRDIQGLEKTAGLSKLIQQTKLIYYLELALSRDNLLKKIVHQLPLVSLDEFRWSLHVKPLDPSEKKLPKEVMLASYNLAKQKHTWTNPAGCWSDRRDSADSISNQHEKNVMEKLRQLEEMVQAQNALISKLLEGNCSKII